MELFNSTSFLQMELEPKFLELFWNTVLRMFYLLEEYIKNYIKSVDPWYYYLRLQFWSGCRAVLLKNCFYQLARKECVRGVVAGNWVILLFIMVLSTNCLNKKRFWNQNRQNRKMWAKITKCGHAVELVFWILLILIVLLLLMG